MRPIPPASAEQIKDANVRYHDAAAADYDAKWGIDLGAVGQAQVRSKVAKALGGLPPRPFGDALEIGAGTGYFTLNLLQAGLIERATATDISAGMLAALEASAAERGASVRTVRTDAEELPFADSSFDLVFGHAVLRPGGVLAFCGEPSRHGDRVAALPKRLGAALAPAWRRAVGAASANGHATAAAADHELEHEVDIHAFDPASLCELIAAAGLQGARVSGEELVANAFGWVCRSLEATADPDQVPMRWRTFAFRSYLVLQRLDAALLEPHLPAGLFYNLVLSARKSE